MSCVRITESIIQYSTQFQDESQRTIANLLGMWWTENPNRYGEFPSISEMQDYMQKLRGETINIWYSSNENRDLSNFAERPINLTTISQESFLQYFDEVFSTLDDSDIKGRLFDIFSNYTFKTVEGAWQAAKMAFSSAYDLNNEEYTEEWEKMLDKFSTVNGAAAKLLGRKSVKGLNSTLWDQVSPMIMKVLIKTSFEQNPQALKKLLDTGFATLTHTQANDRWQAEFPRVLTEVREELRDQYNTNEQPISTKTVFSTSSGSSYSIRTRENAEWSDITLALAENFSTAGEKLTQRVAGNKYVPYSLSSSNDPEAIADGIYRELVAKGKTSELKLNIAGNGIYTLSESQEYYNNLLTNIIAALQNKGVTISSIRSGGQTGIDEAGIIAAQRLGIPNEVHTTSDFKFRGKDNKDIADENAFKSRFNNNPNQQYVDINNNLVITGSSNNTAQKAKEIGGIDTLRHPDTNGMHFGNPFSHTNYPGTINVGSVKEAVIAFEQWLRGDRYQDVEPERRKWIQEQIKNGSLVGKPLVYYTDKIPDNSYGRSTYDYEKAPNHAHILLKYINLYSSRKTTPSPQTTQQPARNTSKELDTSAFNTPRVSSLQELQTVDLVFDPRVRRDRVTLISRLFSQEVDVALQEKEDQIDTRMMEENLTEAQRDELRKELYSLDRKQILRELTPKGVFERVKAIFQNYLDDTDEGRVQAELNKINSQEQNLLAEGEITEDELFSEEEKLEAAKKKAIYKTQEYKKIVEYFRPLAEEASGLLLITEGIRVDPDSLIPKEGNLNDDDPEGNSELDEQADDYSKEESVKDGWMTNFRFVSSHESLSQAVRKIISETPSLDYEGMIEEDDLGNIRYLDADYVHATLIDKLRYMITSEDMIPLLKDLAKYKPWVEQIIEIVNDDDVLFSQFYSDFRKDFVQYWIQKKVNNPDGTFKVETISINKPEGVYYLLDSWRDNYESGTILDKDSVYEKNGDINRGNATKGLKIFNELNNLFHNKSTQERLDLLKDEEVWGKLMKMFNMIGIDPNPAILRISLENIRTAPGITFTDPIMLLLPKFQVIFKGIQKGEVKSEVKEDGTVKRGDLINTFGSAYNSIALMLAEVTEDAIESSVRENDKTYYSHVQPSYLGKLVKQLKNVREDPEKFRQFIETEFKQYEWFYDSENQRWRSDWIEKLATNPAMRKALQHKVVLNYGKTAYQDWDDLDYTVVLLNEFFSEPKEKMAWYHVPILSDAPSAEFIRFVRYTNGSEIDPDTKKYRTFQEIITDKIIDVITQEYNRIQLVLERDEYIQKGTILPIANFDIERDKDDKRKIKSKGGSEFKFFPELNTLTYENEDKSRETFLQRFERLRNNSPSEFRQFLRDTIQGIMEEGFESTYEEWVNIGLLDELPNGKLKNLPSNIATQGQSQTNQRVVKALETASKYIVFTKEMTSILNKLKGNKAINDKQANAVFEQIKQLLNDKVQKGEISSKEFLAITKDLTTKNNIKDALREYYWNSKFATSQIIEMTTTDLAFYKNMEDFQKRYKEVHAPSTRLNTQATFRGKKVGRTWERTIYLADDVIVSSVIADIEEIFNEKVKRGEITKPEKDYIVSQFKKVNVADAQAYRSLSSYRAMMVMMGQWTDEMETAYEHLTDPNGQWTMEDFNIIWQTKKPFVYTQINNDSGIGGHTGIKTPVQHKNSEFLLLALYDAVAGPLGKQSKLKAINDFMEKRRGIDVVQFESTTKVGKQGTIDINDKAIKEEQAKLQKDGKPHTEYDATISILERVTGIGQGKENPSVVHMVSYEDYGIQTATPEHAIDAVQLIGTQIRKLITADISDNADNAYITIEGVTMTKAKWLKTYNEINTENILQAFKEVDEMFSDIKQVERVLQEEIRGNARYGSDMLRACTLDKDGNFNIPLYDPVQSQRIQTLLNSIIKSRITKQKIKGGALIQVTSYGLSDDLKIVYEGTGKNKRIKYLECYMPAYSREFYEPLMGKDGKLDINKLPDDLRKLIGYRVPTEDKYSMLPIYIKGFLPQQNGSAIMLPAEITTLSGSDFDKLSMLK